MNSSGSLFKYAVCGGTGAALDRRKCTAFRQADLRRCPTRRCTFVAPIFYKL